MNTNTQTTDNLSIEVLKQLAFMQYENEDFCIINGTAYTGKHTDEDKEEVQDFDNDDYYVLTDEEADEKATEYITESLWAFNPSFLASMTDFDEEIFQAIADNGKCESNNDVIYNTIEKTCGIKDFVAAAIQADGRGHFLSSYDGIENEETIYVPYGEFEGENTFYIYRIN